MIVTNKFREAIKKDEKKMELASKLGISYGSLQRWLINDNVKFATLPNIKIINEVTGLTEEQIFEQEAVNA